MGMLYKFKSFFVKHPEEEQVIETIEEIMDEREERGDKVLIDPDELNLLKNLFKLKDIRAGQLCIPSIDIVGISITATLKELTKIVIEDKFTRLPVYDKTLDDIIGVVHVKDLLCAVLERTDVTIKDVMTNNVLFVPSSMRALDLLREMQAKKTQMAVVVDEYGGTDGLITLEDLLEEIVGEIEDEHDALDTPPVLHKIGNSVIQADARIRLLDLEERIGKFLTKVEREEELETIGGLVFHLSGKLPKIGDVITHSSGLVFQVLDADSRHIKQIKITQFKKLKEKKPAPVKKKRFCLKSKIKLNSGKKKKA
ncbi:MAG: HlyC/CorC family transporter [Alphaproteobacteria bacterium]|nr:HlyC/CorC family transporter [Alphaproteobacteria bacterium]MBQ3117672.1 HlyC/CorC family transporter [Alphaproteobacteria bacterium]MBQ6853884.1 HlyC/CorC family transporter [Alphaproteobacteria bacterium]MBR3913889.1 HlyC/CorC family transporter [Alphaproteobacteria bacterium]